MNSKVVILGELLLRLSTPDRKKFVQSETFDTTYGGAEANVAVSLSNFGMNSYFITKLPDNPVGDGAINHIRRFGVKTDYISRGGNRIGTYFLEKGISVRPSRVIYDRAASVLKHAIHGDLNLSSEAEINDLLNGNISGSVQR
jgi:2-dehydro-3-deoxygluconokinase